MPQVTLLSTSDPRPFGAGNGWTKMLNTQTQVNLNTSDLETAWGGYGSLDARFNAFSTTYATQVWTIDEIESRIVAGGAPGDIGITAFGVGTLADGEILARVGSSLTGVDNPITEIFKQNYLTGGI